MMKNKDLYNEKFKKSKFFFFLVWYKCRFYYIHRCKLSEFYIKSLFQNDIVIFISKELKNYSYNNTEAKNLLVKK